LEAKEVSPVTTLAASSCTRSKLFRHSKEQPSQTQEAEVRYIIDKERLLSLTLIFLMQIFLTWHI